MNNIDADGHAGCCDEFIGFLKGGYNELAHMANGVNRIENLLPGVNIPPVKDIKAANPAQTDAMQQGGDAVFALSLASGEGEESWAAKQVTSLESRVGNILSKNLTEETLGAASREASGGMGIAKETGGNFSHVGKVEQAINGLNRQLTHAEKLLERSDLTDAQIDAISKQIDRAKEGLAKATEAIKPKPQQ